MFRRHVSVAWVSGPTVQHQIAPILRRNSLCICSAVDVVKSKPTAHYISRRSALGTLLAVLAATGRRDVAHAVCGEPDPFWAHYLAWSEFDLQVGDRLVHWRVAGDAKKEKKLKALPVLCVGEPGLSMDALDNVELLAKTDRRIIRFDALGSGGSDNLLEGTVASASASDLAALTVQEVVAVVKAAKVGPLHLFVTGGVCGAEIATALVKEGSGVSVASLIFESGSEPVATNALALANICASEGLSRGDSAVRKRVASLPNKRPGRPSSVAVPLLYFDTTAQGSVEPAVVSDNADIGAQVAIPSKSFLHYENENVGRFLDEIQSFLDHVEEARET